MISENRIYILGCPVDNLTMQETIELIDKMIESGKPHQHVVINVDKLLKLRVDKNLFDIISQCDIINADGMPIVWLSKLSGTPLKERVTGIDLMEKLVEHSADKGYRPYFLGSKEFILNNLVELYRKKYPKLNIAGSRNGYWDEDEEDGIVLNIRNAKPDILFIAFGSPKKEFFIKKHLNFMQVPFVMGVGGSFDVITGYIKRAPRWIQKCGLEWFYRFIHEPKRLWKRYLIGNMKFIILAFGYLLKKFWLKLIKPSTSVLR